MGESEGDGCMHSGVPKGDGPQAWIVVGLGFGDEGKGSMVDHLVRKTGAEWVVRFNGGPQAAHHVVTPAGVVHCFAQVGSGSFAPGTQTWLAAPMLVEPLALERELAVLESKGLRDIRSRVWVDPGCPLVTPYHAWLNQLRELSRGAAAHGTCGRGVGEAFADVASQAGLYVGDLANRAGLRARLQRHREQKLAALAGLAARCADRPAAAAILREAETPGLVDYLMHAYGAFCAHSGVRFAGAQGLRDALRQGRRLVFEGAQGVLLDRRHGFWPHVTPSDTTSSGAWRLLQWAGEGIDTRALGVLRAYATRHGAGPLPTEDAALAAWLPEPHNPDGGWQGRMRYGWFDGVLGRYALAADPRIDRLALSCADRLAGLPRWRFCSAYVGMADWPRGLDAQSTTRGLSAARPAYYEMQRPAADAQERLLATVEALLGRRLDVVSTGPAAVHKSWRGC